MLREFFEHLVSKGYVFRYELKVHSNRKFTKLPELNAWILDEHRWDLSKEEIDLSFGNISNQSKEINIPLEFLDQECQYEASIYFQNAGDLKTNEVSRETIRVNSKTVFSRELAENSGLAIIIKKI